MQFLKNRVTVSSGIRLDDVDAAEVHNFKRPMLSSSFEEKDTWDLATFLSDTRQEP